MQWAQRALLLLRLEGRPAACQPKHKRKQTPTAACGMAHSCMLHGSVSHIAQHPPTFNLVKPKARLCSIGSAALQHCSTIAHRRADVAYVRLVDARLVAQHPLDDVGGGEHAVQGLAHPIPAHWATEEWSGKGKWAVNRVWLAPYLHIGQQEGGQVHASGRRTRGAGLARAMPARREQVVGRLQRQWMSAVRAHHAVCQMLQLCAAQQEHSAARQPAWHTHMPRREGAGQAEPPHATKQPGAAAAQPCHPVSMSAPPGIL